jgi:hypothetical protein
MALRQAAGWEFPRGFDIGATQARFDRLGTLLSEAFGVPLTGGRGPQPDAAYFGDIEIPASATLTRAKRTRAGCALTVRVSNFANLATYRPEDHCKIVHPDDDRRVGEALAAAGYAYIPRDILDSPYEGPNEWAFPQGATWFERFFALP